MSGDRSGETVPGIRRRMPCRSTDGGQFRWRDTRSAVATGVNHSETGRVVTTAPRGLWCGRGHYRRRHHRCGAAAQAEISGEHDRAGNRTTARCGLSRSDSTRNRSASSRRSRCRPTATCGCSSDVRRDRAPARWPTRLTVDADARNRPPAHDGRRKATRGGARAAARASTRQRGGISRPENRCCISAARRRPPIARSEARRCSPTACRRTRSRGRGRAARGSPCRCRRSR